jgi:hypothetical protein
VWAEFNETLLARPAAGGYDTAGSDALFALVSVTMIQGDVNYPEFLG